MGLSSSWPDGYPRSRFEIHSPKTAWLTPFRGPDERGIAAQ